MSHLSRACSFEPWPYRTLDIFRRPPALRKNPSTARAILHKILPERISAKLNPDGGWTFDGMTDYRAILKEYGF